MNMIKLLIILSSFFPAFIIAETDVIKRPEAKVTHGDPESISHLHLNKELPAFVEHYLLLGNALYRDNFEAAKEAAGAMRESIGVSGLSAEKQANLKKLAEELFVAEDLNRQRIVFFVLSEQLYQLLPQLSIGSENLYWQNCAMAFDGRGANWISSREKIENPFMGQSMPGCGKTLEKLVR